MTEDMLEVLQSTREDVRRQRNALEVKAREVGRELKELSQRMINLSEREHKLTTSIRETKAEHLRFTLPEVYLLHDALRTYLQDPAVQELRAKLNAVLMEEVTK